MLIWPQQSKPSRELKLLKLHMEGIIKTLTDINIINDTDIQCEKIGDGMLFKYKYSKEIIVW